MPPDPGRIVWVTVPDPRGGNPKRRPAVVLTPPGPDGTIAVVAVTTQIGAARFGETVELPWLPAGHPETGLRRPSEVVCTWVERVPVADVGGGGGHVSEPLLREIQARVDLLN